LKILDQKNVKKMMFWEIIISLWH